MEWLAVLALAAGLAAFVASVSADLKEKAGSRRPE